MRDGAARDRGDHAAQWANLPLTAGIAAMPIGRSYVANIWSAAILAPAFVLSGMLLSRSLGGGRDIEGKIFLVSLVVAAAITIVIWARRRFLSGRSVLGNGPTSSQSPKK